MMAAILAKYRNSILAAILAAILAGCLEMPTPPVSLPTSTKTATAQPTETVKPSETPRATARVLPDVLSVRDNAGGIVKSWLKSGQVVTVIGCKDNWCQIRTNILTGYVFRGCLSGNDDLGCKAR